MFAQEKKLIIGYTARDLNNFPLFAAQARGYFTDAGKDIELVQIRSNIGLSGMLGGSVDYYTSFSSAVTPAGQQGSPIVGIFSMIERPSLYMVTRPEIRAMTEIKGKIIGLGYIGGITATITRRTLANYRISAVEFSVVSSGDLPVRLAGVKSGAIHGTLAGPPPCPFKQKSWGSTCSGRPRIRWTFHWLGYRLRWRKFAVSVPRSSPCSRRCCAGCCLSAANETRRSP